MSVSELTNLFGLIVQHAASTMNAWNLYIIVVSAFLGFAATNREIVTNAKVRAITRDQCRSLVCIQALIYGEIKRQIHGGQVS